MSRTLGIVKASINPCHFSTAISLSTQYLQTSIISPQKNSVFHHSSIFARSDTNSAPANNASMASPSTSSFHQCMPWWHRNNPSSRSCWGISNMLWGIFHSPTTCPQSAIMVIRWWKISKSTGTACHNKYHAKANACVLDHQLWIEKKVPLVIYWLLPASVSSTRWMWLYAARHKCFQTAVNSPSSEKCNSIASNCSQFHILSQIQFDNVILLNWLWR
jgi:hypothetical protein